MAFNKSARRKSKASLKQQLKNNQNITLEEEQIPNVNYKCQRLEYGIRKFSNDFNINNTLFLECINKLISKDNI